ncbi:SOS response-associated peptidase family protein [Pelomonas sp. SE-A7]|uniref:SOS response-associated peptidase n=1 Tax=Pelomonas sp. SE-A7 TaxID=3054953 RepID=UPI00259CE908|nr:SOS response-associated peptidase family protein [Pelomonas sp. SE-A7]MDM4766618.1 SOS response-associated peptidase family protein [Pelomonas sp. SE-A7]
MCSNYKPVTLQDRLLANFGVVRPDEVDPPEMVSPGVGAPFLMRPDHKADLKERACFLGRYGLLPEWAQDLAFGRHTYNCRTETMRTKPAFRKAWAYGHRCIVPVEWLYEFSYETGEPVRWLIRHRTGEPLGVAGLWGLWFDPQGTEVLSFTMLTVNADGHGIFGKLHPPADEKRMPVILFRSDYDDWLFGTNELAERLIRPYPAELLESQPDPLAWKPLAEPKSWQNEPDLFEDAWRDAATDPAARAIKARRSRARPKDPPLPDEPGPVTGDLF